jgi:hypothetical protein
MHDWAGALIIAEALDNLGILARFVEGIGKRRGRKVSQRKR